MARDSTQEASEMAQLVKTHATKSEDLSLLDL